MLDPQQPWERADRSQKRIINPLFELQRCTQLRPLGWRILLLVLSWIVVSKKAMFSLIPAFNMLTPLRRLSTKVAHMPTPLTSSRWTMRITSSKMNNCMIIGISNKTLCWREGNTKSRALRLFSLRVILVSRVKRQATQTPKEICPQRGASSSAWALLPKTRRTRRLPTVLLESMEFQSLLRPASSKLSVSWTQILYQPRGKPRDPSAERATKSPAVVVTRAKGAIMLSMSWKVERAHVRKAGNLWRLARNLLDLESIRKRGAACRPTKGKCPKRF